MLAHFLKLVVIAWASMAVLVVAGSFYRPATIVPWSYLAATFFFVPLLLVQFIIARLMNVSDAAPKATWWAVFKAWIVETRLVVRVFCWQLAFASNRFPDQTDDAFSQRGRRGVVFIHGFLCNRGIWTPWLRKLRKDHRAFVAVNLTPLFGSIDSYAASIDRAICIVTKATGTPPLVICHSMGGLAVRAWLRATEGSHSKLHHIITIGSPHHGTWASRFPFPRNARQMGIDSEWLKKLEVQECEERHKLFTCYYSDCDNIVFPALTATLKSADNRRVAGNGHMELAFNTTVIRESLAWL